MHVGRGADERNTPVAEPEEMLAGQSPYPGADDAGPLYLLQIIRERAPIPLRHLRPDAPRSLEMLLSFALEKDRESRIKSMDELMAALSAIGHEPLPGAPVNELEWADERQGASGRRGTSRSARRPPQRKSRP